MYSDVLTVTYKTDKNNWIKNSNIYFTINVNEDSKKVTLYFMENKKDINIKIQDPTTEFNKKIIFGIRNNYILTCNIKELKKFLEVTPEKYNNNMYIKKMIEKYFNINF